MRSSRLFLSLAYAPTLVWIAWADPASIPRPMAATPLRVRSLHPAPHVPDPKPPGRPGSERPPTPRTSGNSTSCIVDDMLVDVCPIDPSDLGFGGALGGGGNGPAVLPDFNPLSGSIRVPAEAQIGEPFQFQVLIENRGNPEIPVGSLTTLPDIPIDGILVHFHILRPGSSQPGPANLAFRGIFAPGHPTEGVSYLLDGEFPLPGALITPGARHQFAVVVDPENRVVESNEANNVSFDTDTFGLATQPDLVPLTGDGNASITPDPVHRGETAAFACRIQNTAAPLAGPAEVKVRYTAVPDGSDPLGSGVTLGDAVHSIPPGATLPSGATTPPVSLSKAVNLAPGSYTVRATVDPAGTIPETASGEGNNVAVIGSLVVMAATNSAPKLPDLVLVPGSIQVSRGLIRPGSDSVEIGVDVLNASDVAVPSKSRLKVFLQEVANPSHTNFLAVREVGPLGPREMRRHLLVAKVLDHVLFVNAGPMNLLVFADAGREVRESRERNNFGVLPHAFTIVAPDVARDPLRAVTHTVATTAGGSVTTFIVPMVNRGTSSAGRHSTVFTVYDAAGVRLTGSDGVTMDNPGPPFGAILPGMRRDYRFDLPLDLARFTAPFTVESRIDSNDDLQEEAIKHAGFLSGEDNNDVVDTVP